MVTILLSGGLGNQMFQYAAAKGLAMRLDSSLTFDIYPLIKKSAATKRDYELSVFSIENPIKSTLKGKLVIKLYPFIQKHRSFFQRFGIFTDTYAILYQPVFETLKGNVILSGYFQNEKYFENIIADLHSDFAFRKPLTDRNLSLSEKLIATSSISVHIRRGDYISHKDSSTNFATCDKDYYQKAITYITERVDNPSFYIFSEEIDWVKDNLDFGNHTVTYVDWNRGKDSYIDMQLMSLCKHNIIANSSFSWWGAWLNQNADKIVIAPSKWFLEEKKNKLLDDFYPKGWTKI